MTAIVFLFYFINLIILIVPNETSCKKGTFHKMLNKKFRVALKNKETRNFKAKVLIQKMSITTLAQIEKGDLQP